MNLDQFAQDASALELNYRIKPIELIRKFESFHDKSLTSIVQVMSKNSGKELQCCESEEGFLACISMKFITKDKHKIPADIRSPKNREYTTRQSVQDWCKSSNNLAIILEIIQVNSEGKKVMISKCRNQSKDRLEKIAILLSSASSQDPNDQLFILKFLNASHPKPIDLVAPEHIFREGTRMKVLHPGASFYIKDGDTIFRAFLAGNKEFPSKDKIFLHTIDTKATLFPESGRLVDEWISSVFSSARFRRVSEGFQIAFALSNFDIVSAWAAAKYPIDGESGDLFKRRFESTERTKKDALDKDRHKVDPMVEIQTKRRDSRERVTKSVPWSVLQATFERFTRWTCYGPGSYQFRYPQRCWEYGHGPGEGWIGKEGTSNEKMAGKKLEKTVDSDTNNPERHTRPGEGIPSARKKGPRRPGSGNGATSALTGGVVGPRSKQLSIRDLPYVGKYIPGGGVLRSSYFMRAAVYDPGQHLSDLSDLGVDDEDSTAPETDSGDDSDAGSHGDSTRPAPEGRKMLAREGLKRPVGMGRKRPLESPGSESAADRKPRGRWPVTEHDFSRLKESTALSGDWETFALDGIEMRVSEGRVVSGSVRLHLGTGAAAELAGKDVHSLCTVIAGRSAEHVRVPASAPGAVVVLVVSASQWSSDDARRLYTGVLEKRPGEDDGWWGVAVADDTLLPAEGGSVSHRRLLSLRLAMLLRGSRCKEDGAAAPRIQVQWSQWVQVSNESTQS